MTNLASEMRLNPYLTPKIFREEDVGDGRVRDDLG